MRHGWPYTNNHDSYKIEYLLVHAFMDRELFQANCPHIWFASKHIESWWKCLIRYRNIVDISKLWSHLINWTVFYSCYILHHWWSDTIKWLLYFYHFACICINEFLTISSFSNDVNEAFLSWFHVLLTQTGCVDD